MDEARRNILLLALAQALYSSTTIIVFATAGLVGLEMAPSPALATAPITTFVLGGMFTTIPISLLMQRNGRPLMFKTGALVGAAGGLLAIFAIFTRNYALFCLATAMHGVFQATAGFYRFAAAESADAGTKSIAISWVLTGGVIAAIIGTEVSSRLAEFFAGHTYAGSYLAGAVLALANFALIFLMRLPKPTAEEAAGPRRSWGELLRQPKLVVAMASAIVAYALMNLMMTAAPPAMHMHHFGHADAAAVIKWHVLAMYVPSFFTGQLIKKFGAPQIATLGACLLLVSGVVGLMGLSYAHFLLALILLGLGWNFGFIGGTTMLTECYRPSERGKVQAANDFGISVLMVIASLSSGQLLAGFGWQSVPVALFPPAAITLALLVWLMMSKSKATDAA